MRDKSTQPKQRSEGHLGPNTQHTPGPWKVRHPAQSEGEQRGALTIRYAGPDHAWHIASVYYNADANARLIAAAPDLLAVAKRVAAGGMSYPKYDRDMAAAAIARAEGGAA